MNKLLILLLLFPVVGFSQFKADESGNLYFEKVYQVDGLSQKEIKDKVHEWIAVTFNDANNVIKMNTDDRIVANGLFSVHQPFQNTQIEHKVNFSIITDFKEGRYKLLINNLSSQGNPIADVEGMTFERWKKLYEKSLEGYSESVKKASMKILNNEKKAQELYAQGMTVHGQMLEGVKNKVLTMSEDLAEYVQNGSEGLDEW